MLNRFENTLHNRIKAAPKKSLLSGVDIPWVVFIALLPLYVFGSGGMQPAHILFLIFFIVRLSKSGDRVPANRQIASAFKPPIWLLGILIVNVAIVGIFWAFNLNSLQPVQFIFYYIFNYLLLIYGYMQCRSSKHRFAWSTVVGIYLSVAIQFVASLFVGVNFDEHRQALFFNNPNQLAYFGLSSACIIAVAESRGLGKSWINFIMLSFCVWLVCLSVSKAGIGCALIIMAASMLRVRLTTAPLAIILALVLGTAAFQTGFVEKLQTRIDNTNNITDDQIDGRGYDRLLNYPQYAIVGAGEGENRRFRGTLSDVGGELHSAVGTMLFCYGLTGLSLYLGLFGLLLFRAQGIEKIVVLIPFVYGLTHNGLRFSIAWVFLFFIFTCAAELPLKRASPKNMYFRKQLARPQIKPLPSAVAHKT